MPGNVKNVPAETQMSMITNGILDAIANLRTRVKERYGDAEPSVEAVRGAGVGICLWTTRAMVAIGFIYGAGIGSFGLADGGLLRLALYLVISALLVFGTMRLAEQVDLHAYGMPLLAVATLLSFNPIAVPLWSVHPAMVPFFYLLLVAIASFLSDWRSVTGMVIAAAIMIILMASQNPWALDGDGDSVLVSLVVTSAVSALLVVRNSLFVKVLANTEAQIENAYMDVSRVRIDMVNQRREAYSYEEYQRKLTEVLSYVERSMNTGAADVAGGINHIRARILALAEAANAFRGYSDKISASSAEIPNFLRHDTVVRTLAENTESALAEMTRFEVLAHGISSASATLMANADEIRKQRQRIVIEAERLIGKPEAGEAKKALDDAAAELATLSTMIDQTLSRVRSSADNLAHDANSLTRSVGSGITTLHGLSANLENAHHALQNIGYDTQTMLSRTNAIEPELRVIASEMSSTGQQMTKLVSSIANMLRTSSEADKHRRHPRIPLDSVINIVQDGRAYESRAINLSGSGMLATATPANFRLLPGAVEVHVEGIGVCLGTILARSDVGFHIAFDRLSDEARESIAERVAEVVEELDAQTQAAKIEVEETVAKARAERVAERKANGRRTVAAKEPIGGNTREVKTAKNRKTTDSSFAEKNENPTAPVNEPAPMTKPGAEAKPAPMAKPTAKAKPTAIAKPAAEAKSASKAKPAAKAKPAPMAKPAAEAKPAKRKKNAP